MDIAFVRPDDGIRDLAFKPLIEETLFVLLPAEHRLARRRSVRPQDLRQEPLVSFAAAYSPVLRRVIDDYLGQHDVDATPLHEAETLPMVVSFLLSSGGVTLLPDYMRGLLPASVVARPLTGTPPKIPLALGYRSGNNSPLLGYVLARVGDLVRSEP